MRWLVVAIGLCLFALPAQADILSGKDLKQACSPDGSSDFSYGVCHGYIIAIADAMHKSGVQLYGWEACMADGTTVEQMRDAVVTFLNGNPDVLELDADSLVARGLADRFPC